MVDGLTYHSGHRRHVSIHPPNQNSIQGRAQDLRTSDTLLVHNENHHTRVQQMQAFHMSGHKCPPYMLHLFQAPSAQLHVGEECIPDSAAKDVPPDQSAIGVNSEFTCSHPRGSMSHVHGCRYFFVTTSRYQEPLLQSL